MKPTLTKMLWLSASICLQLSFAATLPNQANAQQNPSPTRGFQLTSSTFANGATLPISMIDNRVSNGVNVCSVDGSTGGNQSPELSWSNAPLSTKTFVVVAYDVTAAFTHWGMYNIPATTTELPANAGVAGSAYGMQVFNDFFVAAEYDGPCPPPNVPPDSHRYTFTVYALDTELNLPSPANFPASGETLYQALIVAGQHGHILATARIAGLYSTTPGK